MLLSTLFFLLAWQASLSCDLLFSLHFKFAFIVIHVPEIFKMNWLLLVSQTKLVCGLILFLSEFVLIWVLCFRRWSNYIPLGIQHELRSIGSFNLKFRYLLLRRQLLLQMLAFSLNRCFERRCECHFWRRWWTPLCTLVTMFHNCHNANAHLLQLRWCLFNLLLMLDQKRLFLGCRPLWFEFKGVVITGHTEIPHWLSCFILFFIFIKFLN